MMTPRPCARCSATLRLLAGLVLGCWLVSPAIGATRSDVGAPVKSDTGAAARPDQAGFCAPEIVNRGAASPAALLESMARLLDQKAPSEAWLGCQPPANLPLAKMQLELAAQLSAKATSTADLVQAKIGRTQADMIRTLQIGVQAGWELELRSQMSQIARKGKVDRTKVKITEDGDKAEAAIVNAGSTILLATADGKWYLGDGEGHDTLARDIDGLKQTTGAFLKSSIRLSERSAPGNSPGRTSSRNMRSSSMRAWRPGGSGS